MTNRIVVLPLYDMVLLPNVEIRIGISGMTRKERMHIRQAGGRLVLLPMKTFKERENLTPDDFYECGVDCEVIELSEAPMGLMLHGRCQERVRVHELECSNQIIDAEISYESGMVEDETPAYRKQLMSRIRKLTVEMAEHFKGGEYVAMLVKKMRRADEYASVFGQFLDLTPEEKYELLLENSESKRGAKILDALLHFKGEVDLQDDLENADDPEGVFYKKAAIYKQMARLENELKQLEPEEDSFEKRIMECGMPEEAMKEMNRVLHRFKQESPSSPEYNSLYEYLDFVTSLDWKGSPTDPISLQKAEKILARDHYGLDKVKERILQHLAVLALKESREEEGTLKKDSPEASKGGILLLVGAPGTGKTSMGRSVADALGRKYIRISLGGIRDEAEIRGHRRTYIGALPGRIMAAIRRAGTRNPVVVLDEVDKLMMDAHGDPAAALLEALDPEQNATFEDHYVNLPFDLSGAFFICTANDWTSIPGPLLDRMEVIQLPGYTPTERFQIAKKHLVKQALEESGLTSADLKFTDKALKRIVNDYTQEAGVRGLKKQIQKACRKAAVEIVKEKEAAVDGSSTETAKKVINDKNLEEYRGNRKVRHDRVKKKNPVGMVTGLAWTEVGGEILFVETAAMNGQGQIHLTGQIGDVMKESAETAVSLIKSLFMDSDLDFKTRDIHIHIPEGAVPKDGPSAGITMFTAVLSLVTGIEVDASLAMTGEISLTGQVLPIGGLPEKLLAAANAGIKRVLIPKENVEDLDEVPEEAKKALKIIPVETAEDVIHEALGIDLPEKSKLPFAKKNTSPDETGV